MALTAAKIRQVNVDVETTLQAAREASRMAAPPQWDRVARRVSGGVGTKYYAGMNDVPTIGRKGADGYNFSEVASNVYTLTAERIGNGIKMLADDVADDKFGIYAPAIALLGRRMEQFPEFGIFDLLKEGDQTVHPSTLQSIKWIDDKAFFATDHAVNLNDASKGTYANKLTSLALNSTNWKTAYAAFMGLKDTEGKPLMIFPNRLIVPPVLEQAAAELLQAEILSNTTNVMGNAGLTSRGRPAIEIVVSPLLADDAAVWYLAYSDGGFLSPMVYQETEPLQLISRTDPKDDNLFYEDELEYLVKGRATFGWQDPRLIIRCEG